MKIRIDSIHRGSIADIIFSGPNQNPEKSIEIIIEALEVFKRANLLIVKEIYTKGESKSTDLIYRSTDLSKNDLLNLLTEKIIKNPNHAHVFHFHGLGYIEDDGWYKDPIFLTFVYTQQYLSIKICISTISWISYDLNGSLQPLYKENQKRLQDSLLSIKKSPTFPSMTGILM